MSNIIFSNCYKVQFCGIVNPIQQNMKTELIIDQHLEHGQWLKTIDFYRDEIRIMRSRLEEIVTKNNQQEVTVHVERYQNQLIIQSATLDQLSHDIRKHEQVITEMIKENPVASNHRRAPVHPEHEEGMITFEKMFNDLRQEFIRFLAKVM
jgi:preprotein translocase subunit SecA